MVEVYADGMLIYRPGLDGYELLGLTVTRNIDKAGTATLIMPPDHPAYNALVDYKTVLTVYRDGALIFRGRPLYPEINFYRHRTVTCEGERGFLQDAVMRPYLYQNSPEAIFTALMGQYNDQVDAFKRFSVGDVTVTDPNGYVRLESESAEQVSDALDRLLSQCGGYIVFDDAPDGGRRINWYADMERQSGQVIELGENLLDYTSTGSNTDLVTAIVPYGAEDENTGAMVDIKSVNGGQDYIQDDEAVALRGFICRPVYWDDVTQPANLLEKAQVYLSTAKLYVTTLTLSAVDLSDMDKNIDTFRVGDWVRVRSTPHGVDGLFLLRERTYNLLEPAQDRVTFGKDLATLTGADVAAKKELQAQVITSVRSAVSTLAPKASDPGQYMSADGFLTQWGTVYVSISTADAVAYTDVAFAYRYAGPPTMSASAQTADPSAAQVSISACDSGEATLAVKGAAAGTIAVNWFAFGKSE